MDRFQQNLPIRGSGKSLYIYIYDVHIYVYIYKYKNCGIYEYFFNTKYKRPKYRSLLLSLALLYAFPYKDGGILEYFFHTKSIPNIYIYIYNIYIDR